MRIALFGAAGQLGTELQQSLSGEVRAFGHEEADITRASSVEAAFEQAQPDLAINAAACNAVDRAEDEPDLAWAVNALGPRNLALACRTREIPLLHVSTDYVFSGRLQLFGMDVPRSAPYRELDTPLPLNAYATSKLAGEHFVRSLCPRHFVVRTCGLYGPTRTPGRGNFVETMIRLAGERDEVRVVDDQTCTPTATTDLARAVAALIETDAYGLYHATSAGETTWCGFAREIFRLLDRRCAVVPITSAEYGAQAKRPGYSVLDCRKLAETTGMELPPWPDALARHLADRAARLPG